MKTYSKNIYKIVEVINKKYKEWEGGSIREISRTLPEDIDFDYDTIAPIYGGAEGDGSTTDLYQCIFSCGKDWVKIYINTVLQSDMIINVELDSCDIWEDDDIVAGSVDIRSDSGLLHFQVTCVIYNDVLKKNNVHECEGSNSVILEGTARDMDHILLLVSNIIGIDFKKATRNFRSLECTAENAYYEGYVNYALMTFFLTVSKTSKNSMYSIE